VTGDSIPVVLAGGEQASGLADMLQQFVEQTVAESPRKARQARRLSGRAVFRSVEDEELCVRITFGRERIELCDCGLPGPGEASISADFLTIAHLTAGQENPFRLLAQRKLKVRFSARQLPFLLRMLRFMQMDTETRRAARARWLWPAGAVALAAVALYWYVTAAP
jgi:SCP-2 sterol transfer family